MYSNYAYYYLTTDLGQGNIIENANSLTTAPDLTVNTFDDFEAYELEDTNLLRSGKLWFGEHFYNLLEYDFDFSFQNRVQNEPVKLLYSLIARSSDEYSLSSFDIKVNNNQIGNIEIDDVNWWGESEDINKFEQLKSKFHV